MENKRHEDKGIESRTENSLIPASASETNDDRGNRRDFLASAGKVGAAAALAHIMMLGGANKIVLAAVCDDSVSGTDNCVPAHWDGGTFVPEGSDRCDIKNHNDPDECVPAFGNLHGDSCEITVYDTDQTSGY